jgi:hypothetical protein
MQQEEMERIIEVVDGGWRTEDGGRRMDAGEGSCKRRQRGIKRGGVYLGLQGRGRGVGDMTFVSIA